MPGPTSAIVLITKTKTQNQGNQALSIAWRDFLAAQYPQASLRLLERAPTYLKRFTVAELHVAADPVAAFDDMAHALLAKRPAKFDKDPSRWKVAHDPGQQQVLRFLKLRQALRLRSRLAAFNVGAADYHNRLAYLTGADMLVVNPAGEFSQTSTDVALHYLLETRCAQLAGVRTAFVNFSFELADKALIKVADHVFSQCDVVEYRDVESQAHMAAHGGTSTPLIYPDGALMTALDRPQTAFGGGIALAINALQLRDNDMSRHWDDIIEDLRASGPITLSSNEWSTDYPFWQKYLALDGITCDGETLDCFDYAKSLAKYDVVVSSRLHTCVLGLVAGAAIVPVETGTFKMTGFFNQIGMMNEPIRMGEDGWQARVLVKMKAVAEDPAARVAHQDKFLTAARKQWQDGIGAAFSADLLARGAA
jgi:polysaccharide pyruvyl transferase WcaK-like protein